MQAAGKYLRSIGIFQPIPHLNKTTGPEWLDNYTPELARLVQETYSEDYKTFGYANPME